MLNDDDFGNLLVALATGYDDRAKWIFTYGDGLDDQLRSELFRTLEIPAAEERLRALAEILRGAGASHDVVNQVHRAAFYAGDNWKELTRNELFSYFLGARNEMALDKWNHYFKIYDRHLSRFRGKPVKLLEIGTFLGGGLAMLRHYLGDEARLVGMDADPRAVQAAAGHFHVVLGDQEDVETLQVISEKYGPFDIVIDDGGHTMSQQITSIETLFPLVRDGGVYIVEDCHTSYWPEFGGGLRREGTFVEWIKARLDDVNGYHAGTDPVSPWTKSIEGIHYYDSLVVFDRGDVVPPFAEVSGTFQHLREDRIAETIVAELVAERDAALAQLKRIGTRDSQEFNELRRELLDSSAKMADLKLAARSAKTDRDRANVELRRMRQSKSWKLTAPIRRSIGTTGRKLRNANRGK